MNVADDLHLCYFALSGAENNEFTTSLLEELINLWGEKKVHTSSLESLVWNHLLHHSDPTN